MATMAPAASTAYDPFAYAASLDQDETKSAAPQSAASSYDPFAYAVKLTAESDQPSYNPATGKSGLFDYGFGTVKVPGWLERGLEGAGKSFVDLGRGALERVGLESPQAIAEARKLDQPLMDTTAAKVGNVAGGVASTVPALFVPGVNTVAGGAALGGALGFLQPTAPGESATKNTLTGAALGGIGTGIGNWISDETAALLAFRRAADERLAATYAERDAVLTQGRAEGLKVPPTAIRPTLANTAVESVAGKAATRQAMQAANQKVFNRFVASDLGIPEDTPMTLGAIRSARNNAGKVYESIKNIGRIPSDPQYHADLQKVLSNSVELEKSYPGIGSMVNQQVKDLVNAASVDSHNSESAVQLTKLLRNNASGNFKAAFRSGDPERLELAKAQQGVSHAIEDLIGRHLEASENPELAQEWQNARTTIAKSYQAQAALKGGNIDMTRLAKQVDAGKPMTGLMGLGAKFAGYFPEVSSVPKSGPGVSKLAFMAGMLGEGGAAYLHSPELALGGVAAVAAPYALRKGITSGLGQALLATPKYPGFWGGVGDQILKGTQIAGEGGLLAAPLGLNPYSKILMPQQ